MNRSMFRRDFVLVLIGQIISLFGNAALRLALPLYLLDQTGSAALFGLVSAVAFLPMIVLSPVGGIAADRLPKAKIMACLDFFTAVLTVGLALTLGVFSLVPLITAALMLLYGIQGVYTPSVQSSLPLLAAPEDLLAANAAVNLVSSLSSLVGPVIGSMLYGSLGLHSVLWVSAGCFLASAVMELFIHIPHVPQPRTGGVWATIRADFGEGLRFLLREKPVLLKAIGIACALNLVLSAMFNVGYPVLIKQHLGLSSQLYGLAESAAAVGSLLGGLLAGTLGKRLEVTGLPQLLMGCGGTTALMAAVLALGLPAMASYGVLLCAGAVIWMLCTICSLVLVAFLQGQTPGHLAGKVISCAMTFSMCSLPIGQVLYGFLFETFASTPWWVLLASASASLLIALAARKIFRQAARLTNDANFG